MKHKHTPTAPEALTSLLDECFPRLPDGEFPPAPSLPGGGCFPQRQARAPKRAPAKPRVKRPGASS